MPLENKLKFKKESRFRALSSNTLKTHQTHNKIDIKEEKQQIIMLNIEISNVFLFLCSRTD